VKILTLCAIALIGAPLISGQAVAANYGTLILKAGETQTAAIGATGRSMRVCNDFFSSGPVAATIGGNLPRDLSPGVCAEEIGDRVTVESHADGLATVDFKSLCDGSEMSR
jgi:hypothetical protein